MQIEPSFLNEIIAIAKAAGTEILKYHDEKLPLGIKHKHDDSPVTLADLAAHNIIKAGLAAITPDIPLLSEEEPDFPFEQRSQWQTYWLVDPLDGTREFILNSGQYTVNIALIHEHLPVLGVIYVPRKNRIYAGASSIPSFKEEQGSVQPLKVRTLAPDEELIIVSTRREMHERLREQIALHHPISMTYRSSSLKFCLICEGRADIYLRKEPIHEWDTAAGQSIVENAGGIVLDSNWQALRYNTKPLLLNPPFIALGDSKQLLPLLKKIPMFEEI